MEQAQNANLRIQLGATASVLEICQEISNKVAIHNLVYEPVGEDGAIFVDGSSVHLLEPVVFDAPKAAALLSSIPDDRRVGTMEELLEYGAVGAAALETSTHLVMLETKVGELASRLSENLAQQLEKAGGHAAELTENLLEAHKHDLAALLQPLTDTNAKNGLPATLVELLDQANRDATRRIGVMLADGDDGVLAKIAKQITDQIKETSVAITKQLATREALFTRSNLRGLRFEDALAVRLPPLVRTMGRAEHCATAEGDKARNAGDYVITLDSSVSREPVAIVIEAKSQKSRLSVNEIRKQLKLARANRSTAAGILVAESAHILPHSIGFGQVSDCDFYVAFDPHEGDETALTCALYMAKVAALTTASLGSGDQIDLGAAQREIIFIRGLLDQFSKIEICHSKVDKEITNARTYAADLKSEILTGLRRLDSVLGG